jgi:hypothetical protein
MPPEWVPKGISIDPNVVRKLVEAHGWTANPRQFDWVDHDDAVTVATYLEWSGTIYWDWVVEGGLRGYSLYLHELTELKWYVDHGHNPFDPREQIRYYDFAHSLALLVEHRFLQLVARVLGLDFSLKELILHNPHGDPAERDWDQVQIHRTRLLAPDDLDVSVKNAAAVQSFYQTMGFCGRST